MSRAGIILVYIFGSCAIACLLAYPVSLILDAELDKIVSRGILVCAVLLFYPAYKLLNIKSPEYLGFYSRGKSETLVRAWLIGITMLIPLSVFFLLCGYREWEPVAVDILTPVATIVRAIVAGVIIALIEETLFRGLLQTELSNAIRPALAIALVSFLYASVHFLEVPDNVIPQTPDWTAGFSIFFSSFTQLGQITAIWDSWMALFTAGIFLSVIRQRTDNIFWCIGIHAGWVTHVKVVKAFTDRNNDASCGALVGTYDKFIGELSTAWILFLLIVWATMILRQSTSNK